MEAQTEYATIECNITLHGSSQSSLTIHARVLSLTKQNNELIESRLTFSVNLELYQHIDTNALFNLQPEMRSSFSAGKFLPKIDIQIETSLKPDLLPQLQEHALNAKEAANYLLHLSQEKPDHPLLFTENWLALYVKQQQDSGEIGDRTFWSYVSPKVFSGEVSGNEDELSQGLTQFFQNLVSNSLNAASKEFSQQTQHSFSNFFEELTQDTQTTASTQTIFQAIINFFTQDDWSFTRIQGETELRLGFQGDNGIWNCYAEARETHEQFIFYSICPVVAPENKRSAVAEFITRANYSMIIGNFEMDFDDGEIRYKTSIDIDGDELTQDIIKRLVYANVTMMDEYLPGIINVIEKDVSPVDAIGSIEQTDVNTQVEG
jgi:hypothetical protein